MRKAEKILDKRERTALVIAINEDLKPVRSLREPAVCGSCGGRLHGKGKSGGPRLIYYLSQRPHASGDVEHLRYAKDTKVNLSQAERNELKTLVPELVREFMKGRHS